MTRVVGVRFRTAGKIYFFDPVEFEIKKGDNVIVETARGIEFGTVVGGIREVEDEQIVQPLKPVLRIATERDKEQEAENKIKEKEAFQICLEKIRKHELEMKLIDAEYTFDNNKVLFYFTADGRIDFRELVKDLASVFRTRIELRQIGVRDETKTVGGIGICGRVLCCHSYLSDFIPVSIKMAKEQNLSLNPTKISGVCGRLMCCLKHEEDTYEELNRKLPAVGDTVTTEDGLRGEVQSVNVLRQLVKVIVEVNDEKEIREYETDKLKFKRRHGKKDRQDGREELASDELSREELKALELLEKQETQEKNERPDRGERSERGEKSERNDRGERSEYGEKTDRRDRGERQERKERNETAENGEAVNKDVQDHGDRQDRGDRQNRRERRDRGYRGEHKDRRDGAEHGEHRDRRDGAEHGERRDRKDGADRDEYKDRKGGAESSGQKDRTVSGEQKEHIEGSQQSERGERSDRGERRDRRDRNRNRSRGHRPNDRGDRQEGNEKQNDDQAQ